MAKFLAIQNTYTHLQIALFHERQSLASVQIDKTAASKECINAFDTLLRDNRNSLSDLDFIAVNQGPGPFTTLRVVISTVNGLSFARKIPLVGVNAIESFLQEYADQPYTNKVILLNAFGNDVYYGIQIDNYINFGYNSIQSVLLDIAQKIPDQPILFLGNGTFLYQQEIQTAFATRTRFLNPNPETVSLNQIGLSGLQQWHAQENISYQLQPLYLKQAFYTV